jgi:hypothetical protein
MWRVFKSSVKYFLAAGLAWGFILVIHDEVTKRRLPLAETILFVTMIIAIATFIVSAILGYKRPPKAILPLFATSVLLLGPLQFLRWGHSKSTALAIVAILYCIVLYLSIYLVSRKRKEEHWPAVVRFIVGLMLAIAIATYVTLIAANYGWAVYQENDAHADISGFAALYAWHLVDLIPLSIWSGTGIESPLEPKNRAAGALVFVFRVIMVAPLLVLIVEFIKRKLEKRPKKRPTPSFFPFQLGSFRRAVHSARLPRVTRRSR